MKGCYIYLHRQKATTLFLKEKLKVIRMKLYHIDRSGTINVGQTLDLQKNISLEIKITLNF